MLRCGHLFNGIGGFALAAHWMGWSNVMHCEIDPFCNKVMNHHFPNSFQHEDIRTTDFTIWRGSIDLITGGFPCQPYSTAGKRKGTADDRHLWPQMLRASREIQPGWIVGENVRGLTNWNGGLVFDEVQADLEAEGYKVLTFLLPAAGVNAPHRRDRIWFIAHRANAGAESMRSGKDKIHESGSFANAKGIGRDNGIAKNEWSAPGKKHTFSNTPEVCIQQYVTNAECLRLPVGNDQQDGRGTQSIIERSNCIGYWQNFPTQSPVCNRNDGIPFGLADYPVSSKYGSRILKGKQAYGRWRKESIKALGNAIVPQVAYQIFKAIEQYLTCPDPKP